MTARRRLRVLRSFVADVAARVRGLRAGRSDDEIETLRAGLDEARTLLRRFPAAGAIERQIGRTVLRRLILRRVPYVIWYVQDGSTVWLVRLFYARQSRVLPAPRPRVRR